MTPAAIYLRTTIEESVGEYALVNDIEKCRAYAANRGYVIIGEFNDMRPGTSVDRPGLAILQETLAARGGGVMVVPGDATLATDAATRASLADALARQHIAIEVAPTLAARTA